MISLYNQNVWNKQSPNSYRYKLIRSLISDFNADICTFQECGPLTVRAGGESLPILMSDEYVEVHTSLTECNYTPVYYRKSKFDIIDSGYLLYEGLNDENSKSVMWSVLEERNCQNRIAVASTHFWWKCDSEIDNQQRLRNVEQLKAICDSIVAQYHVPVVIGGDFNNGENSPQGKMPYEFMLKKGFKDVRLCADKTTNLHTHHKYYISENTEAYEVGIPPEQTIDYIFIYGDYPIRTKKFNVLVSQDALNTSDHCPLIGEFDF